jgi:hypothetical protein
VTRPLPIALSASDGFYRPHRPSGEGQTPGVGIITPLDGLAAVGA